MNLIDAPQPWRHYSPTRIIFGEGSISTLGSSVAPFGSSACLVTGRSSLDSGLTFRCVSILQDSGLHVSAFHDIHADPTVHQANQLVEYLRVTDSKVVVAVGGGSVIDACKAAAVVAYQGGKVEEYLSGIRSVGAGSLPVIAVPTTAGTGAELSMGAILTWPEQQLKSGIRGGAVFPRGAIVDPILTQTLPAEQVKITGFDVFTHAVETYISRVATPMTANLSQNAVESVCRHLPELLAQPENREARVAMSYHSMLMGDNLANSSTCLPHRLQYPLGALTGTAHALGLAALYPAWVTITHRASADRFADVAGWMDAGMGVVGRKPDVQRSLSDFMGRIDLLPCLSQFGVTVAMCHQMAGMVSGRLDNDPWWQEGNDISKFYLSAL